MTEWKEPPTRNYHAEIVAERDKLRAELEFEKHNHAEWLKIFDARTAERDAAIARAEAEEKRRIVYSPDAKAMSDRVESLIALLIEAGEFLVCNYGDPKSCEVMDRIAAATQEKADD